MKAIGLMRRFPCGQGEQFELIGQFWDQMRAALPGERLCGVGYGWENDTLCYLIGALDDRLEAALQGLQGRVKADFIRLLMPDEGWETWECELDRLDATYEAIYAVSRLDWEIEWIDGEQCTLMIHRITG